MRAYAKQAKESLQAQNDIAEIKLRAERRIGEFSRDLPKDYDRGNQYKVAIPHDGGKSDKTSILTEAGITHCERYEAIASLPEEAFEKHICEAKQSDEELTTVGILKVARQMQREKRNDSKIIQEIPTGTYEIIYCDPPWQYEFSETDSRKIENQYPTIRRS